MVKESSTDSILLSGMARFVTKHTDLKKKVRYPSVNNYYLTLLNSTNELLNCLRTKLI